MNRIFAYDQKRKRAEKKLELLPKCIEPITLSSKIKEIR